MDTFKIIFKQTKFWQWKYEIYKNGIRVASSCLHKELKDAKKFYREAYGFLPKRVTAVWYGEKVKKSV